MVYFDSSGRLINPFQEQRHQSIKEKWQPMLDKMVDEIAHSYRLVPRQEWYGYKIEYDEKFYDRHPESWFAYVQKSKKKIVLSPKFFVADENLQRNILQHELSHVVLGFRKHTHHMGRVLESEGINLHVPIDWRGYVPPKQTKKRRRR